MNKVRSFRKSLSFSSKSKSKNVVAVDGAAPAAAPAAQPAAPPPTATTKAPAAAPPAPANDDEKQYELEVPPNTLPGAKLKLTIPGMAEKVVITVPEGAVPGSTISFSLPKSKLTVAADKSAAIKVEVEIKAAVKIQARLRGKSVRKDMTKIALENDMVEKPTDVSAEGESEPTDEYTATEVVIQLAPGLMPDTGSKRQLFDDDDDAPPTSAPPPTPVGGSGGSGWGLGGVLKRSLTNVLGVFQQAPALPACGEEAADASDVLHVCSTAIGAWEESDFDAFAAVAVPTVALSLPGVVAEGMSSVWQARLDKGTIDGMLSLDTVMVQLDDAETATLVGMLHAFEVAGSGMVAEHSWVRMTLCKQPADGADAPPAWKLRELVFDPIWPKPTVEDATPEAARLEASRLGLGRTLRLCTDAASLASVFFTSWLAGDRNRFEATADASLCVSIKALDLEVSGATAAYDARSKFLAHGNLLALNSVMVDAESEGDKIRMLAHAHLYDTAEDKASGQPTVHFAVGLTFSAGASPLVTDVVSDVVWMGEGNQPETQGLSFESPPLNSVYTRALTFVKAWEILAVEGIKPLTSPQVELVVPTLNKRVVGHDALLAYRETLGVLGMLTVDTTRVTETRFEAYLHEWGIDPGQYGLPRMHASMKLDFEQQRDGSVLISRVLLSIEFTRPTAALAAA